MVGMPRRRFAALELYERAAKDARRQSLVQDEALAYELAARVAEKAGRSDFAHLFAAHAYHAYLRWGAQAKAHQLQREFNSLLNEPAPGRVDASTLTASDLADLTVRDFTSDSLSTSQELSDRLLDTTTVMRAAQTISSEVVLDRVLAKLLHLVLEHAGAQKASTEGRAAAGATAKVFQDGRIDCAPPRRDVGHPEIPR